MVRVGIMVSWVKSTHFTFLEVFQELWRPNPFILVWSSFSLTVSILKQSSTTLHLHSVYHNSFPGHCTQFMCCQYYRSQYFSYYVVLRISVKPELFKHFLFFWLSVHPSILRVSHMEELFVKKVAVQNQPRVRLLETEFLFSVICTKTVPASRMLKRRVRAAVQVYPRGTGWRACQQDYIFPTCSDVT